MLRISRSPDTAQKERPMFILPKAIRKNTIQSTCQFKCSQYPRELFLVFEATKLVVIGHDIFGKLEMKSLEPGPLKA